MTKLWSARERNRITWDAYRKIGRPREALRQAGDAVFNELSTDEKLTAERVFLELYSRPSEPENFSGTGYAVRRCCGLMRQNVSRTS